MERIDLCLDNQSRVTLNLFDSIDSKQKKFSLKGKYIYECLNMMSQDSIKEIYEDNDGLDIRLIYEEYVVNIRGYRELLSKRGLESLKNHIRIFLEKNSLKKIKHKKVQRKNKYSNRKIIAAGLSLALISGVLYVGNVESKTTDYNNSDVAYSSVVTTEGTKISNNSDSDIKSERIQINYSDKTVEDNQEENKDEVSNVSSENNLKSVFIDYSDRSEEEKAYKTKSYYGDLIEKYAKMYGLDTKLVTAIATQERGIHSSFMDDGGATGLMQIQNSVWLGNELTAYNFEDKCFETITVDSYKISDVSSNIKIGCMILQNAMEYMNYNILAAVQCYNMGYGNMMTILEEYSRNTNKSIEQILSDQNDNGWLNYRNLITMGDQNYIENVLSWIGSDVDIKVMKTDDSIVNVSINNENITKKVY